MRIQLSLLTVLIIFTGACNATAELKPFEFKTEVTQQSSITQKPTCIFSELKLPSDFAVFAAGAYSGRKIPFQIDQSGHEGTQIDVAVNSPDKPVVLMLGAYEPTIWNIGWSPGTKILAVLVSGYHRQVVAGLEKNIPQLISSHDNRGPCGYFYISNENLTSLNPMARRVFGRPVEMVFLAKKGQVVIGEPLQMGTKLVTSTETIPTSFYDKNAPIAGPAGLEDAVRKGILRKATVADADAWADAIIQNSPQRDIPPVAGKGIPKPPKPSIYNAYVVLKSFTYPAGLYGGNSATFIIPKGIPRPSGNPGHSAVYDFNTLNCQGPLCGNTPPTKDQSGKPPISHRDDASFNVSKSLQNASITTSAGKRQPSKQQLLEPDADCLQEMRTFDKSLTNDESIKRCTDSVTIKSKQKYSSECLKQLESKKFNLSAACQQEMQIIGQAMITELRQCTHMEDRINSSISSNCREQMERYQKKMAACAEISQKIASICVANIKCYEEHQAEREAACNGLR